MSLLIWAAVLATGVAWALPFVTQATPVPAGALLASASAPQDGGLVRLLGTPPPRPLETVEAPVVNSRFILVGVVAPSQGQASGLAMISVDGKLARSVSVGREIEPGVKLLAVSHRQAELGPGGGAPGFTLALPPLAEANRGRLGDQAGVPSLPGLTLPAQPPMPAGVPLRMPAPMVGVPGQLTMPRMVAPGQLALPQGSGAAPREPADSPQALPTR